ncbi:MAG TPA: hypothetical protein VH592_05630 [Gemmataceae bacterium]
MQKEHLPCPSALRRWLAGILADRLFHGVLLVWALCSLTLVLCVNRFGLALPWADEWGFTAIASGQESLSWSWLWVANNEHRQPLLRLGLYVLGELSHWNWQAMHYGTLACMVLGALALLFAARSIRGQSALSDTFLCLVVLCPGQFETIWEYAYSFGAPGGLTCIALALAAIRWPQRSLKHLMSYWLIVMVVTLTGGPAGNLMTLGLAGALVLGVRETTCRAWKIAASLGAALIVVASGLLLFLTPAPHNPNFVSNSLLTTLRATAKESVCWLGPPVLQVLWPWVSLVLLLPSLWVVGRIVRDLVRWRRDNQAGANDWLDLVLVWGASFLVAASIAYGRARLELWAFRYMVLTMPIGIILYLLLVRMKAPLAIPQTLAVVMAILCGWNWPTMLAHEIGHRARATEFVRELARGDAPLSKVCKQHCSEIALPSDLAWAARLTTWMVELRRSDQCIFRKINGRKRRAGEALPQAWEAESGELSEGWICQPDETATQGRALRIHAAVGKPASVVYHVQVTVSGDYQLCCRMRSPKRQTLTVTVDRSQPEVQTFRATADFRPCVLTDPLHLEPGQHDLALTLSPVGSDLDLLELVPLSPTSTGKDKVLWELSTWLRILTMWW